MTSLLIALDHQLNLNLVIWIFPLAFLIHDLEEIFIKVVAPHYVSAEAN